MSEREGEVTESAAVDACLVTADEVSDLRGVRRDSNRLQLVVEPMPV